MVEIQEKVQKIVINSKTNSKLKKAYNLCKHIKTSNLHTA